MMDGKGSPKSDEQWIAKSSIFVRLSKKVLKKAQKQKKKGLTQD